MKNDSIKEILELVMEMSTEQRKTFIASAKQFLQGEESFPAVPE